MKITKEHTVSIKGETTREVTCEHCGALYEYLLQVEGDGKVETSIFGNSEKATVKAEEKAKKDLEEKLKSSIVCAPCPSCGKLQAAMINDLRWTWGVSGLMLGGGLIVAAVLFLRSFAPPIFIGSLVPGSVVLLGCLGVVLFYDPNRHKRRLFTPVPAKLVEENLNPPSFTPDEGRTPATRSKVPALPSDRGPEEKVPTACGHCQTKFRVNAKVIGREVKCPKCGEKFKAVRI